MRENLAHASMLLAQIEGKLLKLERIQPNLAAKLAEGWSTPSKTYWT